MTALIERLGRLHANQAWTSLLYRLTNLAWPNLAYTDWFSNYFFYCVTVQPKNKVSKGMSPSICTSRFQTLRWSQCFSASRSYKWTFCLPFTRTERWTDKAKHIRNPIKVKPFLSPIFVEYGSGIINNDTCFEKKNRSVQNAVCSLQSAFCTDRKKKEHKKGILSVRTFGIKSSRFSVKNKWMWMYPTE